MTMSTQIVPDELCPHVEIGAEMVGGFVFAAETPPREVGMCKECLDRCLFVFENPQPLSESGSRQ